MQRTLFDAARLSATTPLAGEAMLRVIGSTLCKGIIPEVLDPYCKARFDFLRKRYEQGDDAGPMIRFLTTLTWRMRMPACYFPRLVQALPDRLKRAYVVAGLWHSDTETVIRSIITVTGYTCIRAMFDAMQWFTFMRQNMALGPHHASESMISATKVIFT